MQPCVIAEKLEYKIANIVNFILAVPFQIKKTNKVFHQVARMGR